MAKLNMKYLPEGTAKEVIELRTELKYIKHQSRSMKKEENHK